jgi:hypothetical protein
VDDRSRTGLSSGVIETEDISMTLRFVSASLAAAFLAVATVHPVVAEEKKVTPQQQKMKDCSTKWKEEKAAKKLPGSEHNKFMSSCLKG